METVEVIWRGSYNTSVRLEDGGTLLVAPGDRFPMPTEEAESRTDVEIVRDSLFVAPVSTEPAQTEEVAIPAETELVPDPSVVEPVITEPAQSEDE